MRLAKLDAERLWAAEGASARHDDTRRLVVALSSCFWLRNRTSSDRGLLRLHRAASGRFEQLAGFLAGCSCVQPQRTKGDPNTFQLSSGGVFLGCGEWTCSSPSPTTGVVAPRPWRRWRRTALGCCCIEHKEHRYPSALLRSWLASARRRRISQTASGPSCAACGGRPIVGWVYALPVMVGRHIVMVQARIIFCRDHRNIDRNRVDINDLSEHS